MTGGRSLAHAKSGPLFWGWARVSPLPFQRMHFANPIDCALIAVRSPRHARSRRRQRYSIRRERGYTWFLMKQRRRSDAWWVRVRQSELQLASFKTQELKISKRMAVELGRRMRSATSLANPFAAYGLWDSQRCCRPTIVSISRNEII